MIEITFKNYRCFGAAPQTIRIEPGVTAFLGPNNAGKSSVLRVLRDVGSLLGAYAPVGTLEAICQTTKREGRANTHGSFGSLRAAFCDKNALPFEFSVASLGRDGEGPELSITCSRDTADQESMAVYMRRAKGREPIDVPEKWPEDSGPWKAPIGSLRGVLNDLQQSVFVGPFRNALNVKGEGTQHFDITVGQPLVESWRVLKSGKDPQAAKIARRLERQIAGLLDLESLAIDASHDMTTFHLTIGEGRYELADMGSGAAHLITVLLNLAFRKPAFVLIDEPESGLHPRLQLRFLETLQEIAGRGVVIATHNVGLARSAGKRIYTIRVAGGESRIDPFAGTPSVAAFMGEMNFSAYRDLGYDRLLLVEGPTDLPVLRHFLRLMGADRKVVLLPLCGDARIGEHSAIELEEVKRICPHVSAMIDSERAESEPLPRNREAFAAACEKAGIPCHVLQRRAIENYFTEAAVKSVLKKTARALGHHETPEEAGWESLSWSKRAHNWRIAEAMTLDDLDNDMGEFLKHVCR